MSDKKPEAAPEGGHDKGAAPAGGGGSKALLPAIIAIVLAPAATWGVAQFVLLPQLRAAIATANPEGAKGDPAAAAAHGGGEPADVAEKPAKEEKAGGGGKASADAGYKFQDVVVNLAGTMGTRYLKASFIVVGDAPDLQQRFESNKAKLVDVTLAILSSLTLSDLEEAGSKNILRERLIFAYNQALGERVATNIYFSDFVVQ